jgi:ring-1,2-phenylacetyl-CoA epoxidase subunit PaaD
MPGTLHDNGNFSVEDILVNPSHELSRIEPANYTPPVLPAETSDGERKIWELLATVPDPEVPVLSVVDLGIIRKVLIEEQIATSPELAATDTTKKNQAVVVTITPTYSGCPAMDAIALNIRVVLLQHGYRNIKIETVLSPAWTTEWMSEAGKQKLKAYGIAPPNPMQQVCRPAPFQQQEAIQCPRCNSYHTQLISQFGSTACKAFYQCQDCKEPFDYFKCH